MTVNHKKYRENKTYKGIWLEPEQAQIWDVTLIRSVLNGKLNMLNSNDIYVKHMENLVKHMVFDKITEEDEKFIEDIIGHPEEIR